MDKESELQTTEHLNENENKNEEEENEYKGGEVVE